VSAALDDILRRRSALVARSRSLRLALAVQAPVLERPLAWADKARKVIRWSAEHRVLLTAAVGAATLLRPRRALSWSARALGGWRLWRTLQPLLQSPWKPPAR
jgi:hypothetical protein